MLLHILIRLILIIFSLCLLYPLGMLLTDGLNAGETMKRIHELGSRPVKIQFELIDSIENSRLITNTLIESFFGSVALVYLVFNLATADGGYLGRGLTAGAISLFTICSIGSSFFFYFEFNEDIALRDYLMEHVAPDVALLLLTLLAVLLAPSSRLSNVQLSPPASYQRHWLMSFTDMIIRGTYAILCSLSLSVILVVLCASSSHSLTMFRHTLFEMLGREDMFDTYQKFSSNDWEEGHEPRFEFFLFRSFILCLFSSKFLFSMVSVVTTGRRRLGALTPMFLSSGALLVSSAIQLGLAKMTGDEISADYFREYRFSSLLPQFTLHALAIAHTQWDIHSSESGSVSQTQKLKHE